MRPTSKKDLLSLAVSNWEKMNMLILEMNEKELTISFDFSKDEKKKEAHWRRDKNLRDILIHLYEWHMLVINWVSKNKEGIDAPFFPHPYNWKTYGELNVEFWKKHQNTSLEEATNLLNTSHKEILNLIEIFNDDELFSHNVYSWVGGSTLGGYFVSATSSHYDWAIKKLKAHKKTAKSFKKFFIIILQTVRRLSFHQKC